MSKMFARVISFEINPEVTDSIESYHRRNITLYNFGLSDTSGEARLYIPVLRGIPLKGWASLRLGNCPDTKDHIEKTVLVRTLDGLNIADVVFIKIDVEGHEYAVLKGAEETINRYRPLLLIEIKRENERKVFEYLVTKNYMPKRLQEIIGVPGSEENMFFVPHNY